MVHDHHRTMIDGEPTEATLELVAIDDRRELVRCRRLVGRQQAEVRTRTAGLGVPRRSRRAPGADTTRPRSGPGRAAAGDPARWRAAPAASRPRRGRCRAGSCAPPHGAGRQRPRRGSQMPLRRPAAPVPRVRYPCLFRIVRRLRSAHSPGMGCARRPATQCSAARLAVPSTLGLRPEGHRAQRSCRDRQKPDHVGGNAGPRRRLKSGLRRGSQRGHSGRTASLGSSD